MSNLNQDIVELEKLCEQLYNANSTQQIQEANKVLETFANSQDCLNKCKILLDRGIVRSSTTIQILIHFHSNLLLSFFFVCLRVPTHNTSHA